MFLTNLTILSVSNNRLSGDNIKHIKFQLLYLAQTFKMQQALQASLWVLVVMWMSSQIHACRRAPAYLVWQQQA